MYKNPAYVSEFHLMQNTSGKTISSDREMGENQENTASGATVNNYFVNMLELGSEATNPDLVYISIPNVPSMYFSLTAFYYLMYISFYFKFLLKNIMVTIV